mgnify:CR=1 FL=1
MVVAVATEDDVVARAAVENVVAILERCFVVLIRVSRSAFGLRGIVGVTVSVIPFGVTRSRLRPMSRLHITLSRQRRAP